MTFSTFWARTVDIVAQTVMIQGLILLQRTQIAVISPEKISTPDIPLKHKTGQRFSHRRPALILGSLAKGSWIAARLTFVKRFHSSRHSQHSNNTYLICRKTEGSPPRLSPPPQTPPTLHYPHAQKTGQRFSHRYPVVIIDFCF